MDTPVQAIVFSGGGAYGAYEVGVVKALAERGWPGPQVVSGASAGAFNAALLAGSGMSFPQAVQRLEDVWLNSIPGNVFEVRVDPRPLLGFGRGPYLEAAARWMSSIESLALNFGRRLLSLGPVGPFDERLLQLVDLSSFISVAPLEHLLHEIIDAKKVRESPMRVSITATNWSTGQPEVFTNEKMTDANTVPILLGSAAIPGFFPPRSMGGSIYVDGGLVMNTPLLPSIQDGADEIRIIYMDPDIAKIPVPKIQNTFDTLDRVLSISLAMRINADIENARRINRAVELFDESIVSIAAPNKSQLAAIAGQWERVLTGPKPRKLTIHRYHPRRDLGGLLGLLRFEKDAIQELIQKGYRDTIEHDCEANNCERASKGLHAV